jgi:8-oxo-dGTP diphosphatase
MMYSLVGVRVTFTLLKEAPTMPETTATDVLRIVPSVDVACFRVRAVDREPALEALLVRRTREPFAGHWALPGGVVRPDERLAGAARRVLQERTGLDIAYLEQLYTFDEPARDPRGRTLAITYLALLPDGDTAARAGREVEEIAWRPVEAAATDTPLAFDHGEIVRYAHERLRGKVEWTPLVFRIVPQPFTLPEVRRVYEAIQGERYNDSNFRIPGIEPVPELDRRSNRPAQRFRYAGPLTIAGPPGEPSGDGGSTTEAQRSHRGPPREE